VSFGRDLSSNSEFRVAGVPSLSGDSSGRSYGLSWSELLPNLPKIRAYYLSTSSDSSVFGSEQDSKNSSKNLTLNSEYRVAGFDVRGNFTRLSSHFDTPLFLAADNFTSASVGTSYNVSAQHGLPLHGSFGLSAGHSSSHNDNGNDWSSNSYSASTSIAPWRRLTLYQNATFTTDLAAAFAQSFLNGTTAANLHTDTDSSGVFYSSGASLMLGHGFTLNGHFNHRVQWFAGRRNEDSQFGGSINYNFANRFLGMFYVGLGVMDTASKVGNDGAGFNGIVGMSRKFGFWDVAADFGYAQNVQTLISIATTSSYNYGASVRRKINNSLRWNAAFRGSHSGLVLQSGNGNQAESFSTGVAWRRYNIGASYSQSNGTAVFTSSGELTATPLGSLITNDFLLFNARNYSVNASTHLFRRVLASGGYSRFTSGSSQNTLSQSNSGDRYNFRMEYKLRKFSFIGDYNRSMQAASTVPGGPRLVNSYSVGISRWFNVF
jgi:hypothetical protein